MAPIGYKAPLVEVKQKLSALNYDALCGMSFGVANTKNTIDPLWTEIHALLDICIQGVDSFNVPDGTASEITSSFKQILQYSDDHSKRTTISEFERQREQYSRLLNDNLRTIRERMHYFSIGAVHNAGLLNPAQIIGELEKKTEASKKDLEGTLAKILATQAEVQKFADKVVQKARDTARSISFKAAQDQFASEQVSLAQQLKLWGGASIVLILGVIGLIVWFYHSIPDAVTDWHPVIIRGVIRLFSLSAASGLLAYCLGIFRAYLHMYRLNQHRQRVSNCIASFTEAGERPETRDLVLINLVETVCAFGNSGLLSDNHDSIGSQKASVESFSRALSAVAQQAK